MIGRLLAKIQTFKDHADRLNRSAEVEAVLLNVSVGKRPILTKKECAELAYKLGVPSAYQRSKDQP